MLKALARVTTVAERCNADNLRHCSQKIETIIYSVSFLYIFSICVTFPFPVAYKRIKTSKRL